MFPNCQQNKMRYSKSPLILMFLLLMILILCFFQDKITFIPLGQHETNTENNPLDGCVNVYLDMGTNYGHQIRLKFQAKVKLIQIQNQNPNLRLDLRRHLN